MKETKNLQEIIKFRREKIKSLREIDINPFPYNFEVNTDLEQLVDNNKYIGKVVKIAGRVISLRKMGKTSFVHILSSSLKQQLYLHVDNLQANQYDNIARKLDVGDIIGAEGEVFITKWVSKQLK